MKLHRPNISCEISVGGESISSLCTYAQGAVHPLLSRKSAIMLLGKHFIPYRGAAVHIVAPCYLVTRPCSHLMRVILPPRSRIQRSSFWTAYREEPSF